MENRKVVVANLKMNMTLEKVTQYLDQITSLINTKRVAFCPTSIYVPYFLDRGLAVGLQNCFHQEEGAYTGEISPHQAASMGISCVILGHSERRQYFDESDSLIQKKIVAALKNHLSVILCIGETAEDRNMLRTDRILKRQLINDLRGLTKEDLSHVRIAYEPIWAIGTNKVPDNRDIKDASYYIKKIVKENFDYDDIPVLYGGSVNEKNIESINQIPNLSGVLVGGASLDPQKLSRIIEVVVTQ